MGKKEKGYYVCWRSNNTGEIHRSDVVGFDTAHNLARYNNKDPILNGVIYWVEEAVGDTKTNAVPSNIEFTISLKWLWFTLHEHTRINSVEYKSLLGFRYYQRVGDVYSWFYLFTFKEKRDQ